MPASGDSRVGFLRDPGTTRTSQMWGTRSHVNIQGPFGGDLGSCGLKILE